MAIFRRPKGALVRAAPDWNLDLACTVGGVFSAAAGHGAALDLFNNATDGSSLHVWKVWVGNDAGQLYAMTGINGHGANFLANATAVVIPAGGPPGALYYDTIGPIWIGTFFPVGGNFGDRLYGNDVAGTEDQWYGPGPICVIQPGYSLRVYEVAGSATTGTNPFAVSFYYLALPGPVT